MHSTSLLDRSPAAIPVFIGVAAFFMMALAGSALLNDPDTYWHIATGRYVLEHGAVPSSDPFSHTMPGASWHAHEWAAGTMLALAHDFAGWTGVTILAASAIGLSSFILAWGLSTWLRPFYVVAITAIALIGFSQHIVARPHVLVMPVLMLWAVLIVRARARGERPPLAAALLMVPWANMHGSFVIGLGFAALLALEALLEAENSPKRMGVIRDWGLFGLVSLICALATPYGLQGFLFPFHIGGMERSFHWIAEWHPPDFSKPNPIEFWLMAALGVALYRGLRIPPVRLIMCLGLLHLTLAHVRMGEYLIYLGSILIAPVIAAQWQDAPAEPAPEGRQQVFDTWRPAAACAGIMIAALSMIVLMGVAPDRTKSPVAALAAARQAGLTDKKVFNDYNFGGFLIFNRIPTFIDGRADMYGDVFLDRTLTAASDPLAQPDLSAILKEHDVGWTLLSADDIAARLLARDPNWVEIHRDPVAVIHVPASHLAAVSTD